MSSKYRIGTTSYIIPADILPNVEHLADRVDDVEIVLFEVDDGPNNLPAPEVVESLARLARQHDLTYTIHLPSDLELGGSEVRRRASLEKARRVIDRVGSLDPLAYVVHLEGREERAGRASWVPWTERCVESLARLGEIVGAPERIVVENLEGYPLEILDPVLREAPVSRCVDIGHLWVDGHDPLPYLREALDRTRVIHLHGLAERDHKSLAHASPEDLDPVIACLREREYDGVLTLEIFGEEDFEGSLVALEACERRLEAREAAR